MRKAHKTSILMLIAAVFCIAIANRIFLSREFNTRRADFFDRLREAKAAWSPRELAECPEMRAETRKLREKVRQRRVPLLRLKADEQWVELNKELAQLPEKKRPQPVVFELRTTRITRPTPKLKKIEIPVRDSKENKAPKLRQMIVTKPGVKVSLQMPETVNSSRDEN